MAITLAGGTIHAPPSNASSKGYRSRVVYKNPDDSTYTKIDEYVMKWNTIEEITKPVSTANITVSPSFITDDMDEEIVDGAEILIYVNFPAPDTLWFSGYKSRFKSDGLTGTIFCKSKGYQLETRVVTNDFLKYQSPVYSGRLAEVAKYIVDTYTDLDSQGIYYDQGTTSEKLVYSYTPAIQALNDIKETLGWNLWERQGVVYLQPAGYIDNSVTLTVGDEVKQSGRWQSDPSRLVNKFTAHGASEYFTKSETFNGDGTAYQSWTLTYPYFSNVLVEEYVGSAWVTKTGYYNGGSGSYDYTVHPEPSSKKVIADGPNVWKPASSSNNVRITYDYILQPTYTSEDATSQTTYGLHEDEITNPNLSDLTAVTDYATQYVSTYKDPILRGTLLVRRTDLMVGESVTVVDDRNNINEKMTICRMEMDWPGYQIKLDVGKLPKDLGEWRIQLDSRVRKIEQGLRGSS